MPCAWSGPQVYRAAGESNRPLASIEAVWRFVLTVVDWHEQVLLLKSYLQSKGLKDVYTGGLGSFSLTIMLVFYLEVCFSAVCGRKCRFGASLGVGGFVGTFWTSCLWFRWWSSGYGFEDAAG